jgi:hypothetical protein
MSNENTEEVVASQENDNTAEVGNENKADFVKVSKLDYEKMNQTLGSLKRENKDLKKVKDEPKETDSKPDNAHLEKLEKLSMRIAGIDHPEDMELARKTAKKWNVDIDEVLADEDFKVKLGKQQSVRANTLATSGVRGGAGASGAKFTPEYWMAKGVPPTASDVPDRKARTAIARAMMASTKNGKKFYND